MALADTSSKSPHPRTSWSCIKATSYRECAVQMEERDVDEFRLQVRSAGRDNGIIEGRAWIVRRPKNPEKWDITLQRNKVNLPPGRASIAGSPYSGTPIRFDDLAVTAIAQK